MISEDKKPKIKFYYEGPIYQFGRRVKDYIFLETQAVSEKQAINQFLFQAAEAIGYDRSKGANVDIDREQIWSEEESDGIDWSQYPQGLCPNCHRQLNDSGECPLCDLGDESFLNEDLIVIEPEEAKDKLGLLKHLIENEDTPDTKKALIILMDIYLFQTYKPSDRNNSSITDEEWEEYSDWLNKQKDVKESLTEGCWGMPHTLEQANKLKKLMEQPIDAFDVGDQPVSKNDDLGIGDDTLFDNIGKYRKEHPYGSKASNDVRKVIQKFIKDEVLPNWDSYSYSSPEGDYEGNTWEDGVKEIFEEIANMDFKEVDKEQAKKDKEEQEIKEVPLDENKENKPIKEKIKEILEKYNTEKTSKINIFEVDSADWTKEHFDDGDIDFSKFAEHEQKDYEGKPTGSKYYSFMITGGLNGSGEWDKYLDDISDMFTEIEKELDLEPVLYNIETDIADDVWTGKVFLYEYPSEEQLKESLL